METQRIYGGGCNLILNLIDQKIERFKSTFNMSPSFLVLSKDNYQCLIYKIATEQPDQNAFPEQWQGIPIVVIPGHEFLELVGSARNMYLYGVNLQEKLNQAQEGYDD